MTARAWSETVKQLDSLPLPEAHACAQGLRRELTKFVPRLIRHSDPDEASIFQAKYAIDSAVGRIRSAGVPIMHLGDEVVIGVENSVPWFFPSLQAIGDAFAGKSDRYSVVGSAVRRVMVRASWNNMSIAELRDLNRHRTGFRQSPLVPVGFYLPPGVSHEKLAALLSAKRSLVANLPPTKPAAELMSTDFCSERRWDSSIRRIWISSSMKSSCAPGSGRISAIPSI